jgi:hypothetical protein
LNSLEALLAVNILFFTFQSRGFIFLIEVLVNAEVGTASPYFIVKQEGAWGAILNNDGL